MSVPGSLPLAQTQTSQHHIQQSIWQIMTMIMFIQRNLHQLLVHCSLQTFWI